MYNNYISISPVLSEKELIFFQLFNDLCESHMELKKPQGYTIWLNDKMGSFKDGFEIIHPKRKKEEIIESYNESLEKISQYSRSLFFKENIGIVMNYQNIFLRTKLIHKHSENYQFETESTTLVLHLIKIINLFHKDGFLKKFLELDIKDHIFSQIILDKNTNDSFIIDETDIYNAELLSTGYFKKLNKISQIWSEELLSIIQKKSLQDKLNISLSYKEKSSLQKI